MGVAHISRQGVITWLARLSALLIAHFIEKGIFGVLLLVANSYCSLHRKRQFWSFTLSSKQL